MELLLYFPPLFFPGSGLSLPAHQKRSGIPIMVSGESSSSTANLCPCPEEGGGETCACPNPEGRLWHFSKPKSHPASSATPSLPSHSISSYIRTVQRLCRRPSAPRWVPPRPSPATAPRQGPSSSGVAHWSRVVWLLPFTLAQRE